MIFIMKRKKAKNRITVLRAGGKYTGHPRPSSSFVNFNMMGVLTSFKKLRLIRAVSVFCPDLPVFFFKSHNVFYGFLYYILKFGNIVSFFFFANANIDRYAYYLPPSSNKTE